MACAAVSRPSAGTYRRDRHPWRDGRPKPDRQRPRAPGVGIGWVGRAARADGNGGGRRPTDALGHRGEAMTVRKLLPYPLPQQKRRSRRRWRVGQPLAGRWMPSPIRDATRSSEGNNPDVSCRIRSRTSSRIGSLLRCRSRFGGGLLNAALNVREVPRRLPVAGKFCHSTSRLNVSLDSWTVKVC